MRFEDIHGNGTTVSALRNMVDGGRIPHALMFHENDGGGAIPLALAFIQYLYCRSRSDGDSCGECPVCRRVTKLIHPDIQFICPIASSKEKPTSESYISEIRELLEKNPYFYEHELYSALGIEGKQAAIAVPEARSILSKLSLSGVEGGWRTVIVYLPEKMNASAANTLLKMVEEPPEMTLFLMITHEPEKVLRTIYSRCLVLRVIPLSGEDFAAVHPEDAEDATRMTVLFADLFNALSEKDLLGALEAGEQAAGLENREKQKTFCKFAGEVLRRIFLVQQGLEDLALIPETEVEFYRQAATKCRKSFPRGAMAYFDRATELLERNVNQKIIFADLVDKLYMIV